MRIDENRTELRRVECASSRTAPVLRVGFDPAQGVISQMFEHEDATGSGYDLIINLSNARLSDANTVRADVPKTSRKPAASHLPRGVAHARGSTQRAHQNFDQPRPRCMAVDWL